MTESIEHFIVRHGPEAVCAALAPLLTEERIARIDQVLAARLGSVVALLEDTYDPHNAAAAIRTTEALGLAELHVVEHTERFAAASGITMGSHKWIELVRWTTPEAGIAALRARGFRVLATLPDAPHSFDDVDATSPLAIAFGNEHAGLSAAAIAACDGAVRLPMFGFTESFNLSVTVALAMSQLAVRRRAQIGSLGDLSDDRRRLLRARWFALKLRGVQGILERALGMPPGAPSPGSPPLG